MDYALIVAGGSGQRMGSGLPKQFLTLGELPVLMHTIKVFHDYSKSLKILLVLPQAEFNTWQGLIEEFNFTIPHELVEGGETRFNSVKNGLDRINDDSCVAIHDGVRPFVSLDLIENCFNSAQAFGSGVAAVIPKDSIRKISDKGNSGVPRDRYRLMQTPQTFRLSLIKEAYQHANHTNFTDDAAVAENYGIEIHLVEGAYDNLKLTTPEDIIIAQALVSKS